MGRMVKEKGLKEGALQATTWEFMLGIMGAMSFDRQFSLSACQEVDFEKKMKTVKGYTTAFERMRMAKIIAPTQKVHLA